MLISQFFISYVLLFLNMLHNNGPNEEPCGQPLFDTIHSGGAYLVDWSDSQSRMPYINL